MHRFIEDGCNRSGLGGRRGNIFVNSHHSGVPDRAIKAGVSVSQAVIIRMVLSSAGPKSQPVQLG
jgi:hypothetical protein